MSTGERLQIGITILVLIAFGIFLFDCILGFFERSKRKKAIIANTEETITMCCIRCNVAMFLDGGSPHCPCDGLSLLATGNWPSSVWDEERSAWFVLCDECANKMLFDEKYCLEETQVSSKSHFIPIEKRQ